MYEQQVGYIFCVQLHCFNSSHCNSWM